MKSLSEVFKKEKDWRKKVVLISYHHNKMLIVKKGNWTIKMTANLFNISVGLVSEDLKLFDNMNLVEDCESRKTALEKLK